MALRLVLLALSASALILAQESQAPAAPSGQPPAESQAETQRFLLDPGTRVPLNMINSVSTKNSAVGDRIYLETVFPIMVNGRIVIPPGSYVAGTVTSIKRPGRVKGRGELYVRFDSLTLPNGVTRDFRARIGALDGRANEELDREEGKVKSEGNKSGDARTVGEATVAGASAGTIGGAIGGNTGMGAGIGAAAGAAAGLVGVFVTRGPDAVLAKGTTLDMVLDRPLTFTAEELNFSTPTPHRPASSGDGPLPSRKTQNRPGTYNPFPLSTFSLARCLSCTAFLGEIRVPSCTFTAGCR
jgi:type IV secretion system protein VirB10